jgi:omega-6 fatty acid desaturase (delta-12 desaturase)
VLAARSPPPPPRPPGLRLVAAVIAGLTTVRVFIVITTTGARRGAGDSKLARVMLSVYGILVSVPRVWKETHNYHHAHTAQIVGSHITVSGRDGRHVVQVSP